MGISMDLMNKDVGYLSGDIPSGDMYSWKNSLVIIHLNSSKFHIFGDFSLVSFPHL